jgi:hypothetical protein
METEIQVLSFVRFEGSVVLFEGLDPEGYRVLFAADHRPAQAILEALESGEEPVAMVPHWAFLRRLPGQSHD